MRTLILKRLLVSLCCVVCGSLGWAGGRAAEASFNGPHNLAVTGEGDVYVADTWSNRVRKLGAGSGTIRTIAGTGEPGFAGDGGPAAQARFGGIYCVSLNPAGDELL